MKNPRKLAYTAIYNVLFEGGYSNITINKLLRNSGLDSSSRGFFTELVYGTIENKLYLEYVIQKFSKKPIESLSKEVYTLLLMGVYQIKYMDSVTEFAAVDESVKLAKVVASSASGFVNAILRNILRSDDAFQIDIKDPRKRMSIEYSISQDIVNLMVSQYGLENAEDMFYSFSLRPYIYIRANRQKIDVKTLIKKFNSQGILAEEIDGYPDGIKVKNLKNIEENLYYKEGLFTVQDITSMKCVLELDPQKGDIIGDICACPGGKTTYISEILGNEGKVEAFDISVNKLELIKKTSIRLGLDNISIKANDGRILNTELLSKYDRVLVDVPCSGLGIIRRKPEIRYKTYMEIKDLYDIQRDIIRTSAKYVKSGGTLLYSTCTINKKENEEIVNWFLESHPEFEKVKEALTLPDENGSDGFYTCKMIRR